MVKAYQGQMFKLPVAGDIAEKYSKPAPPQPPQEPKKGIAEKDNKQGQKRL